MLLNYFSLISYEFYCLKYKNRAAEVGKASHLTAVLFKINMNLFLLLKPWERNPDDAQASSDHSWDKRCSDSKDLEFQLITILILKKSDQIIDKLWFSPITVDNQSLHGNNLLFIYLFIYSLFIYLLIIPPSVCVCTMHTCMYRWAHTCLLGSQREIYSITFSLKKETGSLKALQTMLRLQMCTAIVSSLYEH